MVTQKIQSQNSQESNCWVSDFHIFTCKKEKIRKEVRRTKKTVEWDVDFAKEENRRVKWKETFRDFNIKWNAPANETGSLNKAKGTWWIDFLWCWYMLPTIRGFLLKLLDWNTFFHKKSATIRKGV